MQLHHHFVNAPKQVKGQFELAAPLSCLRVAVQQSWNSSPMSWLRQSPAGILWMWRASFSSSSLCLLAWSSTAVSSHLMGWCLSRACSATADFSSIPPSVPSIWSLISSPSTRFQPGHNCMKSGTQPWTASPSAKCLLPWLALSGGCVQTWTPLIHWTSCTLAWCPC